MKRFITTALLACSSFAQAQEASEELDQVQAEDLYRCDPKAYKCMKCDPPNITGCNFLSPCQKTCGKFTPEDLVGTWRGFMAKDNGP